MFYKTCVIIQVRRGGGESAEHSAAGGHLPLVLFQYPIPSDRSLLGHGHGHGDRLPGIRIFERAYPPPDGGPANKENGNLGNPPGFSLGHTFTAVYVRHSSHRGLLCPERDAGGLDRRV